MPGSSDTDRSSDRDLLLGRLAEEYFARRRGGETVSIDDYAERHPELAGEIRDLFPTLELMETADAGAAGDADEGGVSSHGLLTGRRIGEYRIIREIGRGGMGVVFEAEHEPIGRRVALKVLPPHATLDARFLERFKREAQAAGRLEHSGIVPVFDVGEADGVHFYAMQYIDGRGVDVVLQEARSWRRGRIAGGPTAPPESVDESSGTPALLGPDLRSDQPYFRAVARLGLKVAEALAYAHGRGILHRDIKPSNLLVDSGAMAGENVR